MALLGTILLGTGYGLAITIKNPIASIGVFFVAVILVIIGTYLLLKFFYFLEYFGKN